MTSKRTTKSKRTSIPRIADYTKDFRKDWKRLTHSGRYDMNRLKAVMMHLVANDEPLGAEYLDHALSGELEAFRECHIGGNFLLIYRLDENAEMIVFSRTGTHSDLFR